MKKILFLILFLITSVSYAVQVQVCFVKQRTGSMIDHPKKVKEVLVIRNLSHQFTDTEKGLVNTHKGDTFSVVELDVDQSIIDDVNQDQKGWYVDNAGNPTYLTTTAEVE